MKLIRASLFAVLAIVATAPAAMAWEVVASREVADRTDHDTIGLGGPRLFRSVKVCVYRNPVHFYDFDIKFKSGANQAVSIAARLNAGQCTRAIDLDGGRRDIDVISFTYEETSFKRRTATVRVFAQ